MKKLNVIVGVFVAAALVTLLVLLVSTFFSGDENAPETSAPPVSTADVSPTPTPSGDMPETPLPSEDVPVSSTGEALEGERVKIEALLSREYLTVIYNSDLYMLIPLGNGAQFFLESDTSDGPFVEIVFIEDDLEFRKPSFLDGYVPDFEGGVNMLGQVLIPGTTVAAEGLTASNLVDNYAEAWLIDCEIGFLAVVAGYPDEASRVELYRMLATIEFSL